MKNLIAILLLSAAAFAQSWSGQSSSDARIVPPYRFCVGSDNGQDVCIALTAQRVAKVMNGALDFALVNKTVATLPTAASSQYRVYLVTDGASTTDCTVGSGANPVVCVSNGTTWTGIGGGGGGGGGAPGGAVTADQYQVDPTTFGGKFDSSFNATTGETDTANLGKEHIVTPFWNWSKTDVAGSVGDLSVLREPARLSP
jgi:hypothetical protein